MEQQMKVRSKIIYCTMDSSQWLILTPPEGLVPPPVISMHKPLAGPVEFYHAAAYNIPVPDDAKAAAE
jgi:hypothetical protein